MKKHNLAQINIAQAQDEMSTLTMKGFVDRLDEINTLADNTPGFIWRLQSDEGDTTAIRVFDDPLLLINMSVWDNTDSLKSFVYRTVHLQMIQQRKAWFNKITIKHQAMWWIPKGHIPTIEEGKKRLDQIGKYGPTAQAFTFAKLFEAEE